MNRDKKEMKGINPNLRERVPRYALNAKWRTVSTDANQEFLKKLPTWKGIHKRYFKKQKLLAGTQGMNKTNMDAGELNAKKLTLDCDCDKYCYITIRPKLQTESRYLYL